MAKDLALRFKHGDRLDYSVALVSLMARAGNGLLASADVLVPVPPHRWRLLARRYNQAAILARGLGGLSGKPVEVAALVRIRPTPSQGHLGRRARRLNVRAAFRGCQPAAVAARYVLLIDDVLTTGATASACARTLLRAGAASVDVLTLAQVVRARVLA